jgi:hypothetical protein
MWGMETDDATLYEVDNDKSRGFRIVNLNIFKAISSLFILAHTPGAKLRPGPEKPVLSR